MMFCRQVYPSFYYMKTGIVPELEKIMDTVSASELNW
ncbi:MAG: hypothetical protein PWR22_1529 [Moorella sp. (in: firmicutes)]|jgi:hypothetical protein|nr:hypothetical protein [Moorella sp. (in: firmicutes)]GEA19076.1 hypothetical protein E306M_22130 [Moorella sp. E306M]